MASERTRPIQQHNESVRNGICRNHQSEFLFYCEDDDELVCAQCVISTHKRHSLLGIDDIASQNRLKMEKFVRRVQNELIPNVLSQINSINDEMKRNSENIELVINKILDRGKKMKQDIDRIVEDFVLACRRIEQQNCDALCDYKQALNYLHEKLRYKLDSCLKTMGSQNYILMMNIVTNDIEQPRCPKLDNALFTNGEFPIGMLQEGFGILSCDQEELQKQEKETPPFTTNQFSASLTQNSNVSTIPQPLQLPSSLKTQALASDWSLANVSSRTRTPPLTLDRVVENRTRTPPQTFDIAAENASFKMQTESQTFNREFESGRKPLTSERAVANVSPCSYSSVVAAGSKISIDGQNCDALTQNKSNNSAAAPLKNTVTRTTRKSRQSKSSVVASFRYSSLVSCIEKSAVKDMMWLSCFRDNFVSFVDQQGQVKRKVTLGNKWIKVCDISVSPVTGNLWMCCNNNAVYEDSNHGSPRKCFVVESSPWCLCMAVDNTVVLGTERNISIFTTTGDLLISTDSVDTTVAVPHHITICPLTGNIAVCDKDLSRSGGNDKPHVTVFDSKLKHKFQYWIGHNLSKPADANYHDFDAVFDTQGRLFITDCNKKSIQVIDSGGQHLTTFSSCCSQLRPRAVALISDGLLFVGLGEKVIKVISYEM